MSSGKFSLVELNIIKTAIDSLRRNAGLAAAISSESEVSLNSHDALL